MTATSGCPDGHIKSMVHLLTFFSEPHNTLICLTCRTCRRRSWRGRCTCPCPGGTTGRWSRPRHSCTRGTRGACRSWARTGCICRRRSPSGTRTRRWRCSCRSVRRPCDTRRLKWLIKQSQIVFAKVRANCSLNFGGLQQFRLALRG